MPRMVFNTDGCLGVTSGVTGKNYDSDSKGFINVTDPRDVKAFKEGGYIVAGGMPRIGKYFVCECGWEASINSCPRCNRNDLTRVER